MTLKIGFNSDKYAEQTTLEKTESNALSKAVKSLVQVHFPSRNMTLAYYNDIFDLHRGDIVYVDGKLEGHRGRVVDVSYCFKIKLSDYKRVIGRADTEVNGSLYMADSHFVAFDRSVLPFEKVQSWFKAPNNSEEEYVTGGEGTAIFLDRLGELDANSQIIERGEQYYFEDRVAYISVCSGQGRAIVEGSQPYEVDFEYNNGEIKSLVCDCFCTGICKHEIAVLLQLRETLRIIEESYKELYTQSDYFAAVCKGAFFSFALSPNKRGSVTLG